MFHKNQSQGGRSRFSPKGRKQNPQGPKHVSPNYRVNMMHHNPSGQSQQSAPRHQQGGGFVQPRAAFDRPPSAPHARRGFHNLNVEMTEELFKAFQDKLKLEGKTSKEAIIEMITAYTGFTGGNPNHLKE
ncbi:MAG: hypothetical protein HZA04_01290 [Nitrospinae bacterium]|nr:hypothetical protein [Nitrospinota bacterium]